MPAIQEIVLDFEADLLRGVAEGADEVDLLRIRDQADDKLRNMKAGASSKQLEEIFTAAIGIGTRFDAAMKAIRK